MSNQTALVGDLLMLCGCLHDIAEKSKEAIVQKQLADVQERIQSILLINFPATIVQLNLRQSLNTNQ